jgi:uncharacterized membrane protein YkvA (DUF1232 family)
MATRLKSWLALPSVTRTMYATLRLAARLLRDPQVPAWLKALPILGFVYVLSPLDVVPDFFPVIGQMDDIAVVMLAVGALKRFAPSRVVAHHEAQIAQGLPYSPTRSASADYIDADFRRDS